MIFIWYQYDIENWYHYNMKFHVALYYATTSLWCWEKISYNDFTSISVLNWSTSRWKPSKKPMSSQYCMSTGLILYEVITQFRVYYEVPNDNAQRQCVYFIVAICCNTLKSFCQFLWGKIQFLWGKTIWKVAHISVAETLTN